MEQNNFNNQFTNGQRGPLPEDGTQPLDFAYSNETQSREPLPNYASQPVNNYTYSNAPQYANEFNSQSANNYNYSNANMYREPLPQQNYYAQSPVYTPTEYPRTPAPESEVERYASAALGKGIASMILSCFSLFFVPAILAIVFGARAQSHSRTANRLARECGVSAGGKAIAGKILGIIGMISGIANVVIYPILAFLYFTEWMYYFY